MKVVSLNVPRSPCYSCGGYLNRINMVNDKLPPQTRCKARNYKRGKECTFQLGPREILVEATGAQCWEGRGQDTGTEKTSGGGSEKGQAQDVEWGLLAQGQRQGLCLHEPIAHFWEQAPLSEDLRPLPLPLGSQGGCQS